MAVRSSMSDSKSLLALSSIFGREPGRFFGVSGFPSRAVLVYRLTEERLTPKQREASLLPAPRYMASTIAL